MADSDLFDAELQKYVVLGHLNSGDMFGEQSALNDLPNPYTLVAATRKVEYYKIHRANFALKFFGGPDGEQINATRAQMIINSNWLINKLLQIEMMNVEDLLQLEFCSEKDFTQYKATK